MSNHKYVGADLKARAKSLAHGEITAFPFGKEGCPVSLYLAPLEGTPALPYAILRSQLYLDGAASDFPIKPNEWSEPNIIFIPSHFTNANLLTEYRIFWTSGEDVPV